MTETAFCLGSNLGDRLRYLVQAKTRILLCPQTEFVGQSSVYETEPVDVRPENLGLKFLNAVLVVRSPRPAEEWLHQIQKIESALQRIRTQDRNAPRTIDIDLLFSGDRMIESAALQVPHPRWAERRFVVQPLAEVCPARRLPGGSGSVREQLARLPDLGDVRLFAAIW